jgi:predicted ATP-grasp superfamily ATP-dependent carboligase
MLSQPFPYLVVAVTGRALAASAERAHLPVVVLDCFADRDTCAAVLACRAIAAPQSIRFDRSALLAASRELAPPARCAGVVYGSGFEGRPELLSRVSEGRRLLGNPPAVIGSVKEPSKFFPLLDRLGMRYPEVRPTPPSNPAGWLVKHSGGAGGARVRHADRRAAGKGAYYQRWKEGRTLSALFLANGTRALILGINEQWNSSVRPTRPFLYGGAVGQIRLQRPVEADLRARLDALVSATGLVGLNGLDFVLRNDEWFVLEVNPRPTATMELYDPDYPGGLFQWHLRACAGELPGRAAISSVSRAHGIVHAAAPWHMRGSYTFPPWCCDLPQPDTRFAIGDPICTVHAEAADPEQATALVRRRKEMVELAVLAEAGALAT